MEIDAIAILIILILFFIVVIINYFSMRVSRRERFKVKAKLKSISIKKTLMMWSIIQSLVLFSSINNKEISITTIIGLPLIVVGLVLISLITNHKPEDIEIFQTQEYDDFIKEDDKKKRIEERDKKIKKILK